MKVQNPQAHHGHTIVSPGVAPQVKVQAGAGVAGGPAEASPAASSSSSVADVVNDTAKEIQAALAAHAPTIAALIHELSAQPYARRLEQVTIALIVAPRPDAPNLEDAVGMAASLLEQLDDQVEAHRVAELAAQAQADAERLGLEQFASDTTPVPDLLPHEDDGG